MARPAFTLKAAGREIDLRFDMDAIEWFERKRGFGMVAALSEHMGIETTIWLMLAGVRHRKDGTTYEQMKSLLQAHVDQQPAPGQPGPHLGDITNQLVDAMRHYGILPPAEYDAKSDSARPSQPRAE